MVRDENNEYYFPLYLLNFQREQKEDLRNRNYKLGTYILDRGSGYCKQDIDNVKIIFYKSKIYVPQSLRKRVLYWYHSILINLVEVDSET